MEKAKLLKSLAFLALVPFAANAQTECSTIGANLETEDASVVLRVLAEAAGLDLQNSEVASGPLDVWLEAENACMVFPKVARGLGYRVEVEGRKAWLRRV